MLLGDVVNEFHNDNGLADSCATKQADFAALQKRLDEVDTLQASFEHLGRGSLFIKQWCGTVNGHGLGILNRPKLIYWLADDVHHAAERTATDRHRNWTTLVDGFHAAHHTVGGFHGNTTHTALTQVLLHFEDHIDRRRHSKAVAYHFQCLVDRRHRGLNELNVHGRAGDLNYVSNVLWHITSALSF